MGGAENLDGFLSKRPFSGQFESMEPHKWTHEIAVNAAPCYTDSIEYGGVQREGLCSKDVYTGGDCNPAL